MNVVRVFRSDEKIPFMITICDTIVHEEEKLTLTHDTTITEIVDYDYYHATKLIDDWDQDYIVEVFMQFNSTIKDIGE